MTTYTDQDQVQQCKYDPHCPINLPLAIISDTSTSYKSDAILQPFKYEVYCPISCAGIKIGVVNHEDTTETKFKTVEFRTTSSRTVQANVNGDIVFTLNGFKPQKKEKKKTDNMTSYGIFLNVDLNSNVAILNPFYLTGDTLELYTLEPLKSAQKGLKLAFEDKEFKTEHFDIEARKIFYLNNRISYRPIFSVPNSNQSIIYVSEPFNRNRYAEGKVSELKEIVNSNLQYWLTALSKSDKIYNEKFLSSEEIEVENIDEIFTQLGYWLDIDEQVRCQLLDSKCAKIYKQHYPNYSRLYTALQRLSSFLNYGNTRYNVIKLAELGFFNKSDLLQNLSHYEDPKIPIPNIEEGEILTEESMLKKVLPHLRSLNNLPFPNVSLSVSLNSMPAQSHNGTAITKISVDGYYFGVLSEDKQISLWSGELLLLKFVEFNISKVFKRKQIKTKSDQQKTKNPISKCQQFYDLFKQSAEAPKIAEQEQIVPDPDKLDQLISMGFPIQISKQALIATKNQKIQVVIDSLEQIKEEEEVKRKKKLAETKLVLKDPWSCSTCTMLNSSENDICSMCESPAPYTQYIDQEEEQREAERKKKEEEAKIEQQKRKEKQKELKQKKMQEEQILKKEKQEQQRLEQLIVQATTIDFKIIYLEKRALDPFFVIALLRLKERTLLRAFRLGLSRQYLEHFFRRQGDKTIISNFNQSIREFSFQSLNDLIRQARRSVHWGRKFFEGMNNNDWVVEESQDLFFEEDISSMEVKEMNDGVSISLVSGDQKLYVDILPKDSKQEVTFTLKKVQHHCEQRDVLKNIKPNEVDNSFLSVRCNKVEYSKDTRITIPSGHCYFELEVIEHLPKGQFIFKEPNFVERKCEEGNEPLMKNFIPLRIQHFEGALANQKIFPSNLFHPGPLYVSNYPLTNFAFKSVEDRQIDVDSITIISDNKASLSGYPIKSGLIFVVDEISWFFIGRNRFQHMPINDYNNWLKQKGNSQHAQWEPVGAFDIKDKQKSIEFDLDFKRPGKIICLLPTAVFKKGPAEFEDSSVVIDFFGVKGRLVNQDRTSALKTSTISQITNQGSNRNFLKFYTSFEKGEEINDSDIQISQKNQLNGTKFISKVSQQALKNIEVSVSSHIVVRLKKVSDQPIEIEYNGHGKLISLRVINSISAISNKNLVLNQNSQDYPSHLYEAIQVNPFLVTQIINTLNIKKFLTENLLSEEKQLFKSWKLITIFRQNKQFESKLLSVISEIFQTINEQNIKVTSEGLRYLLRLFSELSTNNKPQSTDTVLRIWNTSADFVKKIRNSNYRILRNRYNIKELILEKRLFSEFYHNIINPQVFAGTSKTDKIIIPPKNVIEAFFHKTETPSSSILYFRLNKPSNVEKVRFYFEQTDAKYKLRLKLYKVDRVSQTSYRKSLIYHRIFDEQLMIQLGHYAFNSDSWMYKSSYNFFEVDNININGQFFIFEANYNLIGSFYKNKKQHPLSEASIIPVFISSETQYSKFVDQSSPAIENNFEELFSLKKNVSDYLTHVQNTGIPIYKEVDEKYCYFNSSENIQHQIEEQTSSNVIADEIAANIMNKEIVLAKKAEINFKGCYGAKGLDFSYTFLIMINKFVCNSFIKEELKSRGKQLTNVLLKMYDTFVVNEIGPICENVVNIIMELLQIMDNVELSRFVVTVVDKYLTDMDNLRNRPISEEYDIKHVIQTLQKFKELPLAQLLEVVDNDSSKLRKINVLQLIQYSLTHSNYELQVYDLETDKLIKKSNLQQVLDKLYLLGLGLIANQSKTPSNLQISLLNLCLDNILLVIKNLVQKPDELKLVLDQFLVLHSKQNLWILIFNALKLPDEKLNKNINILMKHLIRNVNTVFNESINRMISQIINKNSDSLYMKISGEVSHEIWMKHLQSMLEFLIKSQQESGEETTKFQLNFEIADSLIRLPLTPALWSFAISILPINNQIVRTLINQLTPELYEILEISIMKYSANFKRLEPLRYTGKNWLTFAKKLFIQEIELIELLVDILKECNYGGREAVLMANQDKVKKLQIANSVLQGIVNASEFDASGLTGPKIKGLIQWFILNRTTELGFSPVTDLMKSLSDNMLKLFTKFQTDQSLLRKSIQQLLLLKKESEIIQRLCREKVISSYNSLVLTQRICDCFELLISIWMKNDSLAHYFAFDLEGYDYLFNMIGKSQQVKESLKLSDEDIFLDSLDIIALDKDKPEKKQENTNYNNVLTEFKEEELANKVKLIKLSGQNITASSEDWTTHKKGSKNKIITATMSGAYQQEYPITIQLDKLCELKYIRLGVLIADTSAVTTSGSLMVATPASIFVEAGEEVNNLQPLGQLIPINDEGYANHSVKIFVKNFQSIQSKQSLQGSIKSLSSVKVKFLKFTFRRPIITFMQGFSTQTSKPYKTLAFYPSFLSITGYDVAKIPSNSEKKCNEICKKTSLVILSQLFNQTFISTINKLSNQPSFVQRVKNNFKEITSLMAQHGGLISSINYILGANNEELGDWMIDYYLRNGVIESYSKLVSQIILSNASKIYPRLQILLNRLLENISEVVKLGNTLDSISKFSATSKFLETFCNSVYSSISSANQFNKLEIKVTEQDVDNIIAVYDSSHATTLASTLIQFLLTLIYIQPPYFLSNDLVAYTLNKVFENCSEQKAHFYEFLTALIVSKKSKQWLLKENNVRIDKTVEDLYNSINDGKIKLIKVYLSFLIQVAMHFPKYLFQKHNLHIEVYNRIKQKQMFQPEIYTLVHKLIQQIIFSNPGSEKSFVEVMIKDLDTLSKRKEINFLKFFMNLLGTEEETHVTMKGLSNIPKQDFTIPSQMLLKEDRVAIVKEISQKSKYTLFVSVDEDQCQSAHISINSVLSTPPYLVIAEFSDDVSEKLLVGAYFAGNVNVNKNNNTFEMEADRRSFMFSIEMNDKEAEKNNYQFFHNNGEEQFGVLTGSSLQLFDDMNRSLTFFQYSSPALKLSFCEEQESFQKIIPEKKHFKVKRIEFWDIKHLNSQAKINIDFQQAGVPMSFYRPQPVYITPAHITAEKLLAMIEVNSKLLYQGKEVEKNKKIGQFVEETQDYIVDVEISLPNSNPPASYNKNYVPKMLLYNEFDSQLGADRLFDICLESIKTWSNQVYKKRWAKFIQDFHCLRTIPNLIQILAKNVNIFTIVIDILLGSPEQIKFTKEWPQIQSKLNIFFYKYINSLLSHTKTQQIRRKLIDDGLLRVVLNKLAVASKETVRKITDSQEQQQQIEQQKQAPAQTQPPAPGVEVKKQKEGKKKKKGTGYGSDSHNNNNTKWNTTEYHESKKQTAEEILRNVKILTFFLDTKEPIQDIRAPDMFKQSCLLPLIQNALRSSSILDVSKEFNLFMAYLELIRLLAKSPITISCLLQLDTKYQPKQNQSIYSLLQKIKKTADIYISCLSTMVEKQDKNAEQIGLEIKSTFTSVEKAVAKLNRSNPEQQMKDFLKLPLKEAYRKLLEPLRFDSVSMKQGDNYKHYHSNLISNSAAVPPPVKTLRLSQELADLSSSLPCQHTNSIFVRCDKDRIDVIRALIMGSKDTPYSNGAFLFDIFCQDSYPNQPPKMVITTTGGGKIRFNPNLYHDGKVCLSLLGTWKGQTTQNWDPKLSTLLQLFVSTQSIIMSEDVYFNEPGYQNEQGEVEGERKNEGYSNIVRIGNIKYAMIDQIKNPPKGFEDIIHRHFYLKKKEILEECEKWITYSQTREAAYTNLTHEHNVTMSTELKKTKTAYSDMLKSCVKQLTQVLQNMEEPKFVEKVKTINIKKTVQIEQDIKGEALEDIDMTYEKNQADKQLNYEDEKVKDRWSRYIGAMGLQAVKKQAESEVLLIGLGTLGLEIAKNLILSGLKRLTIVDNEVVKSHTEHFYLSDMPGEYRYKCIFKLQQLNRYVKVDHSKSVPDVTPYSLVIDTRTISQEIIGLSNQCRKLSKKYISVESKGVYGRIFNDFGEKFQITDVNGEEPVEIIIKHISNQEKGIVKLPEGFKHPYQDGQYVVIEMVEGMQEKEKQIENKSDQQLFYEKEAGGKVNGINGRVFKIEVINSNSFRIGDTTKFTQYIRNGVVKNLKLPKYVSFKSFQQSIKLQTELPFDGNMMIYDFDKIEDNTLIQMAFQSLDEFFKVNNNLPKNWDHEDATKFVQINKKNVEELLKDTPADKKQEQTKKIQEFFYNFSLVAESELPSIDAFLGGLASQQAIKAITNKFGPIQQLFTFNFKELLPEIPKVPAELELLKVKADEPFFNTKVILGRKATEKLAASNIFVVGAGAIGCQLLKNFAMMNLCSSGTLTVTDPDHIETSNLNRQFLFRQKHIRKPKSSTASAAILQMNPGLKGHVVAKLDKVCEATQNIYSDKFIRSLNLIANALDNVQARLYVDRRCVANKIPLLQSGTLGPKGHVQVIIPYKTQSYGSQNDPVEQNQIPHCTLKLFPEETLHCIEWSRDIFGKVFSLKPKALKKLINDVKNKTLNLSEQGIDKVIKKAKNAPKDFDQCIAVAVRKFYKYYRNDIRQLMHTYPLTMKTKEGEPFWKLPKRPPTQIKELDPSDELHKFFISSYAVNLAKTFGITYPKNFRTEAGRDDIMKIALKIKIPDFIPSEEGSKKINELNQEKGEVEAPKAPVQEKEKMQQSTNVLFAAEEKLEVPKNIGSLVSIPEEFEKDEDSNGHIDLIYSMANLRSRNYTLAPYTWIQTKLKAGRIMPALSTTTSVVSALQSIELIKILKQSKVPKNMFANLAVPLIQMSQPGAATKNKIGNTEFTVWDRWEVKASTLKQLYDYLSTTYDVEPSDALIGGVVVYMKVEYKNKSEEEETLMNRPLRELLGLGQQDEWIDFTISFRDKTTKALIETVPSVRVFLL